MKHLRAVLNIVIMLLVVILVVENLEELSGTLTLQVNLLFWAYETPEMPFYLLLIIVFLFGVLVASFFGIVERFRLKSSIKRLMKEKKETETELNSLRNLPIVDSDIKEGFEMQEEERTA